MVKEINSNIKAFGRLHWVCLGLLCCFTVGRTAAQRKIAEMTLSYDARISRLDNGVSAEQSIEVAATTIYLKGPFSRTDMVSTLLRTSTIFDQKDSVGVLLREVGGQKIMIQMTRDQWKENNRKYEGIRFEYTDESKWIAGYICKKAIAVFPDGTMFSVYYTSEIIPENTSYDYLFRDLKGLPMEWEQVQGNVRINFVLSKISLNPVPRSLFDIPKSGYRKLSYEESKKLREH